MRPRIWTDLNLHDRTPVRAQPEVGEWGPLRVVTTRAKRRWRWLTVVVALAAAAALFTVGRLIYSLLMGG
ncbi:MAG: hypothetical protein LBL55_05585 [Propionibacteriaceae bacterium]|nr:hypothetical protein [Propionibacteriaceae bacterium]